MFVCMHACLCVLHAHVLTYTLHLCVHVCVCVCNMRNFSCIFIRDWRVCMPIYFLVCVQCRDKPKDGC